MPTPLKTKLADKVAVREWITERIGSEYLVPLLGVYDSFDDIDFDSLPSQFVIKCSHDEHPEPNHPCPLEYEDMQRIVRELGRDIDQARIDLYLVDGHIYFGEMTITNASGFEHFVPDEWDYKFGDLWPFDNTVRAKVLAEHSRP